jgi:hypothetical protein
MFILYIKPMLTNCELEIQALLSGDIGYLNKDNQVTLFDKIKEVERMLMDLIKSLQKKSDPRNLEPLNPGNLEPWKPIKKCA